jgi:hypothetical protein
MGTRCNNYISQAAEGQFPENDPQAVRPAAASIVASTAVISCAVQPGFGEPVPAVLRTSSADISSGKLLEGPLNLPTLHCYLPEAPHM